jgi:hypothetical protein
LEEWTTPISSGLEYFIISKGFYKIFKTLCNFKHLKVELNRKRKIWIKIEEFFLDGLKKLEQRSHKYAALSGEYVE